VIEALHVLGPEGVEVPVVEGQDLGDAQPFREREEGGIGEPGSTIVHEALTASGKFDILVNNAGTFTRAPVVDLVS
jgi:NAD(P)-dependent dehydrogenase (short-subunit alcohol dehydrogenase family)